MLVSYIELDPFFANWTLPGCFLQLVLSLAWFFWKLWCWSWNSNTLATWCEELTHLKRLWCWERLRAGGLGDDRGWDGWVASPTQWTWIWVNSGSWWWTGRPGVLRFMGFQSQTRLSEWTELVSVCLQSRATNTFLNIYCEMGIFQVHRSAGQHFKPV